MPIKRRGGGEIPLPTVSKPAILPTASKKPVDAKHSAKFKGKKTLSQAKFSIKKRTPFSKYVYLDDSVLVVRTPPECSKWAQDFRLRIVRDYVKPRTMKLLIEFERNFINNGYQEAVYRVMRKSVGVKQAYQGVPDSSQVIVINTKIIDYDSKQVLYLKHDNPAMRMLMVYAFLTGMQVGGMPTLDVAPLDT